MPVISSKPLTAGEVVSECKPLVHCIDDEFKGKVCDNCLKRSDELKRCAKCLQMYYCSKECQRMDWSFHKNECNLLKTCIEFNLFDPIFFPFLPTFHLCLRLYLRLYLRIKTDKTFVTKTYKQFDGSDVCLNDIKPDVRSASMGASGVLKDIFDIFGLKYDRKELNHWFAIIVPNCIQINGSNCGDYCLAFFIQAVGLSHSCSPNAVFKGFGSSVSVRAVKPIGLGEEITISRLNDLALNRTERHNRLILKSIDCKCEKCELNLDSDIDYKRFHTLKDQILETKCVEDLDSFESSVNQFIQLLNAIYGEYYPQKTDLLLNISKICLLVFDPNHRLIIQLSAELKASIAVTHREITDINQWLMDFLTKPETSLIEL